ncbi:hypothetical protein JX265_006634 [Neoarthrinium moseri]|uniref:Fungal calcium binding protein domain-containing protein n=1 Tax=Neoarthrinium moseri TaxID=1658444 RepID=A0A9P9WLW7_9PEZI|nr:uncharacterized protein JN550_002997 [Neoarthrinium moseri]KAI1855225.1 hypothetical protein JX266_000090 [Neoarthrinium moseri]KAI1869544.1 hypothetical protein JX265_006634 [Neoarthrinium moseri]KAI1873728.1 hypothetical protein JN550_002997 [Neoarthrinium moseri]
MQFTVVIVSFLAATGLAYPSDNVMARDEQTVAVAEVQNSIEFAAAAESCNVLKCAAIVAKGAICIAPAILTRNPAKVIGCVAGGAGAICPCGGCVPKLNDFLDEHGVC